MRNKTVRTGRDYKVVWLILILFGTGLALAVAQQPTINPPQDYSNRFAALSGATIGNPIESPVGGYPSVPSNVTAVNNGATPICYPQQNGWGNGPALNAPQTSAVGAVLPSGINAPVSAPILVAQSGPMPGFPVSVPPTTITPQPQPSLSQSFAGPCNCYPTIGSGGVQMSPQGAMLPQGNLAPQQQTIPNPPKPSSADHPYLGRVQPAFRGLGSSDPSRFYASPPANRAQSESPSGFTPALPGMETFGAINEEPGFQFKVNDASIAARAVVGFDTARLDPAAKGNFLPSAIPVRGDAAYGLGERAFVSGTGNSAALTWSGTVPDAGSAVGTAKVLVMQNASGEPTLNLTEVYVNWGRFLFGVTNSTFSDAQIYPDTVEFVGPNAFAWFPSGTPLFRYHYLQLQDPDNPIGFLGDVSVEAPKTDLLAPAAFSGFSPMPDIVWMIRFQDAYVDPNRCVKETIEQWHVQFASVFRDLGVEGSRVRETAFGWGIGLTSQILVFDRGCGNDELQDHVLMSTIYGHGIGHYFPDLDSVGAVNDAAYDSVTHELTALPVLAYWIGYEHEWLPHWRSTATYSRISLDSQQVPGLSPTFSPYRQGEFVSVNLLYHEDPCDKQKATVDNPTPPNVQHHFFAGLEYIFGLKDNLAGDSGTAQRVQFVMAASK